MTNFVSQSRSAVTAMCVCTLLLVFCFFVFGSIGKQVDSQGELAKRTDKNTIANAASPASIEPAVIKSHNSADANTLTFNRDIRPILSENCIACHGFDKNKREADLRLDMREVAVEMKAIVPGKPDESEMIKRIFSKDADEVMPPKDFHRKLTDKQKETLKKWIAEGAEYEPHWAFITPQRPAAPKVKNEKWIRNGIDPFVLSTLEKANLTPADEADKVAIIRRLSLDLIGLPPTIEEVDAFVADNSPDAYDKLIERLLASPHYGERWALWWLDIAHYADTNGYEIDRPRTIWPYRDWVINAFNENMPYTQFVIEQIGGDMLPNATLDQQIATGFLRNTFFNEEGGHDPEQFRWESIIDRVNTTSTAFLGLTMACCQCHDHKYDPLAQKEFFQYFAFLNNSDEPEIDIAQADIAAKRDKALKKIASLEHDLEQSQTAQDEAAFQKWCDEAAKDSRNWTLLKPLEYKSKQDCDMTLLNDNSLLVTGDRPENDTYDLKFKLPFDNITGIKLEAIPDERLPSYGPGRGYYRSDGTFALSEITAYVGAGAEPAKKAKLKFIKPSATFERKKQKIENAIDGNKLTAWHTESANNQRHVAVFPVKSPVGTKSGDELQVILLQNYPHAQMLGRFRVFVTNDRDSLSASLMPAEVEVALKKSRSNWKAGELDTVKKYYLSVAPELKKQNQEIKKVKKELPYQPRSLVMSERTRTRKTTIHHRGDYNRRGDHVTPEVPSILPPMTKETPRNRLELAKWFVDEKNPLVRRVLVNQIWQEYFGRGLVSTPENFGTQGAPPSHPELLDWLACEVLEKKWDLKELHRVIVKSATYRQSSITTAEKLEKDPENILLSRGPRFRVNGEIVRDIALTASGLLSHKVGGPSVYPPQPEGLSETAYNNVKWVDSQGEDRYRRGLYTFRKRSLMHPALAVFDEPAQNVCTVQRVRSNTPLAALNLLNDNAMIEAAQALAGVTLEKFEDDSKEGLRYAFRRCVSRLPKEAELKTLQKYLNEQQQYFAANKKDAAVIAGLDEETGSDAPNLDRRAAWIMTARVMLNLDETITKE